MKNSLWSRLRVVAVATLLLLGATAPHRTLAAEFAPAIDAPSAYCLRSGGVVEVRQAFFGTNNPKPLELADKAAWVLKGSVDEDLDTCIFPDLSSIDSWGLTYHSAGIIRGRDLSKILRYHNPKV
jgi:hypothetical protein